MIELNGSDYCQISHLKRQLNGCCDPVDILEDVFKGRSALVVSAGPSSSRWVEVYESIKQDDPLVVCVKQSLNLVGNLCDIHFLNTANLVKYRQTNNTITIMTRNPNDICLGKYDVNFQTMSRLYRRKRFYLAVNKNFDAYTLSTTGDYRPSGPQIMYESVLYTLVHMGIRSIVTIGWDIAADDGGRPHYYDREVKTVVKVTQKWKVKIVRMLKAIGVYNFVYFVNFYTLKYVLFLIKFHTGFRINEGAAFTGETEMVSASVPDLVEWLRSQGIDIQIISDSKWMRTSNANKAARQ